MQDTSTKRRFIYSPHTGEKIGYVDLSTPDEVEAVVGQAARGAQEARALTRRTVSDWLNAAADTVEAESEALARLISMETGKVIRHTQREVMRCATTLRLSADEAKRNAGAVVPFDSALNGEDRQGYYTLHPLGIILAITPFNDSLNLAAHKLGPALAGLNAVILKPSALAPLAAQRLVEILWTAGVPKAMLQIVHGDRTVVEKLTKSKPVRMISFTGGTGTGEAIARNAGLKKLAMDLGGNAAVIVMRDADIEKAVAGCVSGAYWAAGQNCIGTQRILVESPIYQTFLDKFVQAVKKLRVGDPLEAETDVGPMISEEQARRIEAWVTEALGQGAVLQCGHSRAGAVYAPTVLTAVRHESTLWTQEAFGPVVTVEPFQTFDEAIQLANAGEVSLHSAIFTSNLETAFAAIDRLNASGVIVNDSSDFRFDGMPFGGFKYGSLGREGVEFAVKEMTQTKVACFTRQKTIN